MIDFYHLETVKILEVEMTTFCNASCGACDRNILGGPVNPMMPLEHMSMETWKNLITAENLQNITAINLDGNFGDASMHPDLLEMLEYLLSVKTDLTLKISSNGGARSPEFWKNLSILMQEFSHHVMQFAIDGLSDTNHIYRRNVRWERLIENVTAFNDAGGNSLWRCIIFDHNKHQIEQMIETARFLKFQKFKTYRNRTSPIVVNAYKNLPDGIITSPTIDEFEKNYKVIQYLGNRHSIPYDVQFESPNYVCPFGSDQTVSIGTDGRIWPCCFIFGNTVTHHDKTFPYEIWEGQNDINVNTLVQILSFFRNTLYPAWTNKSYKICNQCLHKTKPPTDFTK